MEHLNLGEVSIGKTYSKSGKYATTLSDNTLKKRGGGGGGVLLHVWGMKIEEGSLEYSWEKNLLILLQSASEEEGCLQTKKGNSSRLFLRKEANHQQKTF